MAVFEPARRLLRHIQSGNHGPKITTADCQLPLKFLVFFPAFYLNERVRAVAIKAPGWLDSRKSESSPARDGLRALALYSVRCLGRSG
jgi:hypothetical protein